MWLSWHCLIKWKDLIAAFFIDQKRVGMGSEMWHFHSRPKLGPSLRLSPICSSGTMCFLSPMTLPKCGYAARQITSRNSVGRSGNRWNSLATSGEPTSNVDGALVLDPLERDESYPTLLGFLWRKPVVCLCYSKFWHVTCSRSLLERLAGRQLHLVLDRW